jgi:hypothetical protein
VNYRQHTQRFFLQCIDDQVLTYKQEAQRKGSQLWTAVPSAGRKNKRIRSGQDFIHNPVSSIHTIGCDVVPNLFQVPQSLRVINALAQKENWEARTTSLFLRK